MPYPESCPECAGPFRNTGTHFTARRNEVGRHVLLELGCQNSGRRFWWDFSTGKPSGASPGPAEGELAGAAALDGRVAGGPAPPNGHLVAPPSPSLSELFLRQLELDRLMLRQVRSWLLPEEARRAAEVAAGATEATYERLALALFGSTLSQLLGPLPGLTLSAEERLELQREKARVRARQRRAALKAARPRDPSPPS